MGVLPRLLRSCLRRSQHRRGAVHAAKSIVGAVFLVALASLFAWSAPAAAQAALPGAVVSELVRPQLAGSTRFTFWGFDVYRASLWVEPGFLGREPERHRFALELRYLRSFKGRDIAQRSIEEMRRLGDIPEAQAQRWLQTMVAAFPDVAVGDRLLGIHLPGQGARFLSNGRVTAEVADAEFARLFFGIWLSDKTSEPRLRQALLGPSVAGSGQP